MFPGETGDVVIKAVALLHNYFLITCIIIFRYVMRTETEL
jgi:hypothetical protein